MQGDPDVLRLLNEQLTSELTAINQYFLHSKMQENWGFTELANYTRAESFDEMRHAEAITDRILLLDGLPNYQRLFSLRVGQTLREQFEADLAIEYDVLNRLKPGIIMCREKQDTTSANLLEGIVADEENHEQHDAERDAEAQRRECRSDQPRRVAPAHRGNEHRKRREIEQRNRERGAGRDRCEHEGGREARGNADQNDLHHLQLSRSLERLEIPGVSDRNR